jgi:NTE family protein
MESCPEVALQVMRTVIRRLRQGNAGPRRAPSFATIAVVPLDPGVDVARFVASLAEQLAPLQPAFAIGLDGLDPEHAALLRRTERLPPEHDHAVTARLLELERARAGTVIYEALAAPVEWTRIAIRQADLVLLLATVDAEAGPRPLEDAFINCLERQLAPRTDLVLLHDEQWREACGARRWLEPRTITEWHHVRCWQAEDFARLARVLSGNPICLVLSGGGARGLAEIGAVHALRDAGVPIDRVGGTSMGAIIGAMVALGYGIEQLTAIHREAWLERAPLSDYTFPAMSIIRGRRMHSLIRETFADHQIEDLPIPYFCISANLTNANQIVHDRGPLWQAVRASSSLPGTGPPLFVDGQVLIDGGVLNNLPVDVMHERYGGFVIGVDVSPEQAMTVPRDLEQVPSGWRLLWNRLNPFSPTLPIPGIFEILYRTATLNACRWANVTRSLADLVILPPVAHFGTLEFKSFDAIIEAGYREAARVLRAASDSRLSPYLRTDSLPDRRPIPTLCPRPAIRRRARRHHPTHQRHVRLRVQEQTERGRSLMDAQSLAGHDRQARLARRHDQGGLDRRVDRLGEPSPGTQRGGRHGHARMAVHADRRAVHEAVRRRQGGSHLVDGAGTRRHVPIQRLRQGGGAPGVDVEHGQPARPKAQERVADRASGAACAEQDHRARQPLAETLAPGVDEARHVRVVAAQASIPAGHGVDRADDGCDRIDLVEQRHHNFLERMGDVGAGEAAPA